MLTRARIRNAHPPSPHSSLSSASPSPEPKHEPVTAVASSSSDDYFSPPTSPPPVRRPRRGRPPTGLGARSQQTPGRVPATGGCVRRMKLSQTINENVMRAYYSAPEGGTNLTAYRERMLSMFQVRVIQRNHRLDEAALELRLEALRNRVVSAPPQEEAQAPVVSHFVTTPVAGVEEDKVEQVSTQCNERLSYAYEGAIREYRFAPLKPKLPRLPMCGKNRALKQNNCTDGGYYKSTLTEHEAQILALSAPQIIPLSNPYDNAAIYFGDAEVDNKNETVVDPSCDIIIISET
uniref:SFRICE_038034 n=1 Tax=Spodoptera frugiperda TaxID=7108 RepID=A0A2H1VWF1_SPOFR